MSRHSKNFGTLFWEEIFGRPKKQPRDPNWEIRKKFRDGLKKNKEAYDKAQRRAKRNGWRHP